MNNTESKCFLSTPRKNERENNITIIKVKLQHKPNRFIEEANTASLIEATEQGSSFLKR